MIADKAYYGKAFEAGLDETGIDLLRKARKGEKRGAGGEFFKPLRQVIESVNATFKIKLDIERHRGKTIAGVCARIAQRVLALTAAIWHNDAVGALSILIVDVGIVAHGFSSGHSFSLQPLSPSATFSGAVGVAVMFCHASFIGFEGTAIYGEESKDPKTSVPRATYIAVAFMGVFYTVTAWLVINAFDPGGAVKAAQADPENFFFDIGDRMVGGGMGTLLSLLIITSLFAAICAFHNNVARYFFALGRQGVLPRRLGETHTTHQSPALACALQASIAFVVVAGFALARRDPFVDLFTWMTGIGAVGIILVQSLAGLAIIAFFRRRSDLDSRVWNTLVAPILGFLGLLTLLFFAFKNLNTLVGASGAIEVGLLVFLFGSFALGLVAALLWRGTDPEKYQRLGAQLQHEFEGQGHHETAVPVVQADELPRA